MKSTPKIKRWKITKSQRPASSAWGRFGGGWQWKLGIQAGTITRQRFSVIVSLLVTEWRVTYNRGGVS